MSFSDEEIIEKILDSNSMNYGFNLLMEKYQERVYWVIRRIVVTHEVADDLAQEVFVKIWKNLEKFNQDAQLFTWIYRIATNEALGYLRKRKNVFFIPIHDVQKELENSLEQDAEINGDEASRKLQKAILQLPEKQRIVFNLRYFDELKFSELAKVLELSEGAVKANYHHAVKKIEQYIFEK